MPQISASGSCSRTAAEISCSCESRGNPSPSMEWRVSGLRVTNSTDRVIREEQLGNTGLRSSLTMRHSQGDTPTLLCLSTNTLSSSGLQLLVLCQTVRTTPSAEEDLIYANHTMVTARPRNAEQGETGLESDTTQYASIKFTMLRNTESPNPAGGNPNPPLCRDAVQGRDDRPRAGPALLPCGSEEENEEGEGRRRETARGGDCFILGRGAVGPGASVYRAWR
ncbi:hypothetical protein AAFF_G00329060 [Aldrovandia affinis]|uniref:Ig-like domain-containing protein n=1 Tax=Aldrovandia affinis TaxID=143900 RepID=A0AAD7WQ81_9TELE|nr:hypothetical protein AAFF_G00329060 [Aldrovandia affinis]